MSSDLTALDETKPDGSLIYVAQLDDAERETRAALKAWAAVEHSLKGRHTIPSGVTASRPITNLVVGALYINTQRQRLEYWDGAAWQDTVSVPVVPIVVANGGTGLTAVGADGNVLTALSGVWTSAPTIKASSLTPNGYIQIGTFLLQWGQIATPTEGLYSVTFSVAFTVALQVLAVLDTSGLGAPGSSSDPNLWAQVRDLTTTGFVAVAEYEAADGGPNTATRIRWLAIGTAV